MSTATYVDLSASRTRVILDRDGRGAGHGAGAGPMTRPRSSARAGRWAAASLRYRVPAILLAKATLFAAIYPLSYLVRFDGAVPPPMLGLAVATLPLVVGVKLAAFLALGSHRGWWRYATFDDILRLAEAATLSSVAVGIAIPFCRAGAPIPRSIVLLDWAGTMLVMGGLRGGVRLFREHFCPMVSARHPRRVFVVGASEVGLALIHAIRDQPRLGMQVVGVLDPDRSVWGRTLGGVRVLGGPDDVRRLIARHGAQVVLVPARAVPGLRLPALVTACHEAAAKVQIVPGLDALMSGTVTVRPRDVDIHDLLCRDPVRLDTHAVSEFLRGRVVLVTGAAGSIGSEICRQILPFRPRTLVLLDHSENGLFFLDRELGAMAQGVEIIPRVADVADAARLRALFAYHRPAVIFHAAAHKHVPMMEANPGEAIKNNVFGTRTLADEAVRAGVEAFVMISTDKAVHPTSVMGACKRAAEMYVQTLSQQAATRLVTVRFGNVLGSNGSVVPLFQEQIRRGGPVTVTHPGMVRYFMTIPEATQLVLQAGALGQGGDIFVLDMGRPVKVVDLARDLIRLSGLEEGREIEIAFTGLRPGEKLYEELYDAGEERLPTPHPKIFRAKHRPCPMEHLQAQFDHIARVVNAPAEAVIAALRELVPEYTPNRSRGESPTPVSGPNSRARHVRAGSRHA